MNPNSSHRVPYDDLYETCAETRVALLIYSGDILPDVITHRLALPPTGVSIAGRMTNPNSIGISRKEKLNIWKYSSEGQIISRDIRRHLDWMLDKLQPAKPALLELQTIPNLTMTLRCIWWSSLGDGGPTLWPEQMRRIADLNLECSFDLQFMSERKDGELPAL